MRTYSIKDIIMNKGLSEEDAKKLKNWYLCYETHIPSTNFLVCNLL